MRELILLFCCACTAGELIEINHPENGQLSFAGYVGSGELNKGVMPDSRALVTLQLLHAELGFNARACLFGEVDVKRPIPLTLYGTECREQTVVIAETGNFSLAFKATKLITLTINCQLDQLDWRIVANIPYIGTLYLDRCANEGCDCENGDCTDFADTGL
jgi:hypothetical protein